MVFSSLIFLLAFLPAVIAAYFLAPARFRNFILVIASTLFYFWGSGAQILILLAVSTVDFLIGWRIFLSPERQRKRVWLVLSIVFNLSLLAYFKYSNFLVGNWNNAMQALGKGGLTWRDVALPLGISFFTFETMSYVIDIYRGRQKPARTLLDYALYISMFPHLVAGPIYRFNEIEPEIDATTRTRRNSIDNIFDGLWQFSLGLGKKIFFANVNGRIADYCFGRDNLSSWEYWIGALAYTFQIYFDFSGYSDMALGMGKVFGFHFPENFNFPYASKSITEFWHRWHMTLSRWFRDYLYIPMGGNQEGRARTLRNLVIVFFLCGLWHGGKWTFVAWGTYHGALLMFERVGFSRALAKVPPGLAQLYTFLATVVGWVLFRSETLAGALHMLHRMFVAPTWQPATIAFLDLTNGSREFWIFFGLGFLSLFEFRVRELPDRLAKLRVALQMAMVTGIIGWSVGNLAVETFNPFIYFRF
jgi:alginate O-acetyltransferase complex protein AlgI